MPSFEKVKKFLNELKQENIKFKKHFYDKVKERPISEAMVREYLKKTDRLLKVEEQLSSLQEASMVVNYKPNYVVIYLVMKLKEKEKDLTIPLTVDLGHGSVRTERTNFAVA